MQEINTKKIRKLFGKFSCDYDKYMRATNHTKTQFLILDDFLSKTKGKLLDIATGTGTIAKYIKEKTNCEIYGIDYCQEMIDEARRKSKGIEFKVGDVHNLPYQDDFFNSITCSYGFYWFENIGKVISEVKRVLRPKGYFILLEEEFKKGDPKPRFSKYEQDYLKELASLENYVGIECLKNKLKNSFKLIKEVKRPIDELHDTIGLIYQK